jgi:hypothetical protein
MSKTKAAQNLAALSGFQYLVEVRGVELDFFESLFVASFPRKRYAATVFQLSIFPSFLKHSQ